MTAVAMAPWDNMQNLTGISLSLCVPAACETNPSARGEDRSPPGKVGVSGSGRLLALYVDPVVHGQRGSSQSRSQPRHVLLGMDAAVQTRHHLACSHPHGTFSYWMLKRGQGGNGGSRICDFGANSRTSRSR